MGVQHDVKNLEMGMEVVSIFWFVCLDVLWMRMCVYIDTHTQTPTQK